MGVDFMAMLYYGVQVEELPEELEEFMEEEGELEHLGCIMTDAYEDNYYVYVIDSYHDADW